LRLFVLSIEAGMLLLNRLDVPDLNQLRRREV
jgi:hypothetical protein